MIISYQLDEQDYLTYQLYAASQSDRLRRNRQRRRWLIPVLYLVLGLLFLRYETNITGMVLIAIAVLWWAFYPLWDAGYHKRHYIRWIRENVADAIGRTTTVNITDDYITISDGASESKIALGNINQVAEIPGMILVRIKGGHALILPENKIAEFGPLADYLKNFAGHNKIPYHRDGSWRWK